MLDTKEGRRLNSLIFLFIVAIIALLILATEIVILVNQQKLYNATIDSLKSELSSYRDYVSLQQYLSDTEDDEEDEEEVEEETAEETEENAESNTESEENSDETSTDEESVTE